MHRYLIVVGDAPATGGAVLPYEGHPISTIDGHRIALVGGRAFCAVCERVGVIAKSGGPYRAGFCAAGVCKPDSKSRTIAIAELFCYLRKTSSEKDSQLSTLIHEVTHFTDCFDSLDTAGGFTLSLPLARVDGGVALKNADNLAGYVAWRELYED